LQQEKLTRGVALILIN